MPGRGASCQPGGAGSAEGGPSARPRVSRRALLQAGLIGGAGAASLPLLTVTGMRTPSGMPQPGNMTFPLNAGWRFGEYRPGAEAWDFDDTGFAAVTVPHSAVELSWRDWDPQSWERQWIYRRHFDGSWLPQAADAGTAGRRVFVDFDGVMASATVLCNDEVVGQHQGG